MRDDSPAAWKRYAQVYGPMITHWCWQSQLRGDDLADLVQEVHTSVLKQIGNFTHGTKGTTFRGWLRVITRNKLIDHFRAKEHAPQAMGDGTSVVSPEVMFDTDDQQDFIGLVCRTLEFLKQEFSQPSCEAFEMYHFENKSFQEIADQQGITAGAARMRVYRARDALKQILQDEWPVEHPGSQED